MSSIDPRPQDTRVPPILSVQFHLRYFPALIWRRFTPHAAQPRATFADHGVLEYVVVLAVCVLVAAIGLPLAVRGSVIGIAVAGLGLLGTLAILILSVAASGAYVGFAGFRVWVFVFCPVLGVTAGAFYGSLAHAGAMSFFYAAAGLAIGYPTGIGAGLFVQRLGWIAGILDSLAIAGLFGLAAVGVVLLYL